MALAVGLVVGLSFPGTAAAQDIDPSVYGIPTQRVAVDGSRRLNLMCLGQGAPVVVLESGLGEDSLAWRRLQERVATVTRVCAYDRAGYGHSDPAARASDAVNTVDDLDRLLDAAGIRGPVVLVGHSAGGLYATLFADRHRDRLAGLVLIDPMFAEQSREFGALRTEAQKARGAEGFGGMIAEVDHCLELATRGELTVANSPPDCLESPPGNDPAVHDEINRRWIQAKYIAANRSELLATHAGAEGDSLDERQEAGARQELGDLPLIILTSDPALLANVMPKAVFEVSQAIQENALRRLAKRSTQGRVRVVSGSGHHVQSEQPQAVALEILAVVEAARRQVESQKGISKLGR
ncbi:MAG: alpha/beta hydrolase [Gemmatimonadaceae bacterium]|nr:alpha/beta hydrolase [Caulobacter sp.]